MTDRIHLEGLRVVSCHGVLEHEKVDPQPFIADITLEVDLTAAGLSDDLSRTVSYADIAQAAEAILAGPPVDLIETLVDRIATAALAYLAVEAVEVTLHKPHAPAGVTFQDPESGGPSVTIRRERDAAFVVALGANLGRRERTLVSALEAIRSDPAMRVLAVSDLYMTDPVGGPDQPDYLNAVVVGRTRLAPWTMLEKLHLIENWYGRTRDVRWGARTLDLDLIQYGTPGDPSEFASETSELTVPHPRAHERAFVLTPWLDADPQAHVRVGDRITPVADVLQELGTDGVRPGPEWLR
ncbi:2-amino-4-hydroxy-6-hydroxymethyldihydropteridine diphosphokinase [Demetria terragena]|uniref:2-amino-4-hydroxy-6- hydroxymethyldihydropteridine diphosphokinase n=1 Tax=Demetria terragena TaxID=63959 RepID=UPI000373BF1D|nr:2-amino-4-hydroxy-6-hydroxymethyldihydropteridine diphosphokinase [Demetria terragena]